MEPTSTMIGVIIALLVVLITIVALFIYRRSQSVHNDVLLTGLSGSGKTALFSLLIHNKAVRSQTSMQENLGTFSSEKGDLNVVDIPGYERLRDKFLSKYKASSRALVYFIDSSTFQKELRDVAEYLYIILSDPVVVSNCRNILIFCNKQDQTMAKGMEVIKTQLEKELNVLRNTKSSQLLSTDGKEENSFYLGSPDTDFTFSQYPSRVDLAEGYVYNKDSQPTSNYEPIVKWLTNKIL